MKTTLLLIRHGQSEGNVASVFTGHCGYPLSSLGHQQAARTAEYIKGKYNVDAVYSSDLPRAFQTAEYTARAFGLPVIVDARFREINGGAWEDIPYARLPELYPEAYGRWKADIGNSRCTDGESVMELADRVWLGLRDIATRHPGQCIAIATHATPVRSVLWRIADVPPSGMQQISWGSNCAVSEFQFEDGKLTAAYTNFTGHLAGMETSLPKDV